MKKLLFISSICFLFFCCNSKAVEKPKDLISEEVMVDILYDLHVFNAIKMNTISNEDQKNSTPSAYIYQKYEVDSLQFLSSDRYYASDVDAYEKLYQRVTDRLSTDKAAVDAILAKNPEVQVLKTPDTKLKTLQSEDSLAKVRSEQASKLEEIIKN